MAEQARWDRAARGTALPSFARYTAALALTCATLVLGCGADSEPATPPYVPPGEWMSFEFDGRDWQPAEKTRNVLLAQEIFVLPGETSKEWTELVTVDLSFGAQRGADLAVILRESQKAIEKECPAVQWQTLVLEKRDAIYEWRRPTCKKEPPQTEIGRISFGRTGIHRVIYKARKTEIAAGLRRTWIESLRKATVGERKTTDVSTKPPQ